jgi:hypothetical protein
MDDDVNERLARGSRRFVAPILAVLLAIAVHAGSFTHAFVYDDDFIFRSPLLGRPWALSDLFLSDGFFSGHDRYTGVYRPLGEWSLILNASLSSALTGTPANPVVFHVVNVLLHALATFLVFVWLSRVLGDSSRWIAGAAAILWAVHPVHVEVVCAVWNRFESLSCIFGAAFLIAYRSKLHRISGALYLAALLCKESAIGFLPLAVAADALFPIGGRRWHWRKTIGPAAALVLWLVVRAHALQLDVVPVPYVENPAAPLAFWPRLRMAAHVQLLYLRDQLAPWWLSTDHSFAEIRSGSAMESPLAAAMLVAFGIVAWLAWRTRRSRPEIALAALGYAFLLAPVSNFVVPIGTIMADRLVYVPSLFVCLFLASFVSKMPSRTLASSGIVALTVILCVSSVRQSRVWKDDLTLFREQVATAPASAKSHGNLGEVLRSSGHAREAVAEFEKSIAIYEARPEPHAGLGRAYEDLAEDPERILEAWTDSLRYGTLAPREVRVPILTMIDLGKWDALKARRDSLATVDPSDPILEPIGHILRAADTLRRTTGTADDLAAAEAAFAREQWADSKSLYLRAIHRDGVPPSTLSDVVDRIASCYEKLGAPSKAGWYRRVAESVRMASDPARK